MHPLAAKIAALQRRLLWRRRLAALCWTLAAILAAAWALGLADYLVRFSDRGLRVMITATLIAVACWAVYHWWIRPRRGRLGQLSVARNIEAQFPQLGDRLASAIEFLTQSEHDPTAGSATLRRAVVADAELAANELPLDAVIDRRPLRQSAIWAAIVAAVVFACLALDGPAVRTAMLRLVAPLGSTEWPRANHLEFRNAPTRLAAGESFEPELVDRGGALPNDVRIDFRITHDGRSEVQSEWMTRVGDVMLARRENVRESFSFRAEGGDDRTMRWIDVAVVEPPQLESLAITLHPPAYTALPTTSAERHLDVLVGTGIELIGSATEPLGAARLIVGDMTIDGNIRADSAGTGRRGFIVTPNQFIAEKSGTYRIELENLDGVSGAAAQGNLRVEPDPPPSLTWRQPQDDLFVLPTAVVPIAAIVKDNLAVARAELHVARSDRPDAVDTRTELYRGPERAPQFDAGAKQDGEVLPVTYSWSLAPLELPVGTQLTLRVAADDYRPGTGQTATPRRITIIAQQELDSRLADRQSQIARRLDEMLTLERNTRNDVHGLEIQVRDAGHLQSRDRDTLQAAEMNQRRVGRALADQSEGVPALADALVAELTMNGIDNSNLLAQMDQLKHVLSDLAAGPLAAAEEQLTAARKLAQPSTGDESRQAPLSDALTTAGIRQDEVVAGLEKLVATLGGSADYGELVRDLTQLRADQLAHLASTRQEIGLKTLPLELRELSRDQRATLNKAAAAEDALARRYQQIEQSMGALAKQLADGDPSSSARLADAIDRAGELAIDRNIHEATRELSENRVGTALAREQQIADALQSLLDTLRDRDQSRPDHLLQQLRAAEKTLASLRDQLAKLRQDISETERAPKSAADERKLAALHDRQQQLRNQTSRLARELERLQAADASQSAAQGADKLADDSAAQPPHPASSSQAQQAEQHLAEAARQLAEHRRHAEEDVAQMLLRQFQTALAAMVGQQRDVLQSTSELDSDRARRDRTTPAQQQTIAQLASKERQLADDAHVQSEMLTGLPVFGTALGAAEKHLITAADRLDTGHTDAPAQQAQRQALAQLEQIVSALEQTAAEAGGQPPGGAGAGQPGAGGQSSRPTFDLFEVKLLRSLQADLNERTQAFDEQSAAGLAATDDQRAARQKQADELAAEQGHLAELVDELVSRNNRQDKDE